MNFSELLLYILAVVVMIATPGPVMLLVASAGLTGGYRKALQTIVGTNLASLILIAISVLILKGFLKIDPQWFAIVKILGCVYIAYLGYQIIQEALSTTEGELQPSRALSGGFKQGFLVAISNPKDIIFFAAFFPQFIQISSDIDLSLMILTITWIILDFSTLTVVYLAFNRLSKSRWYHKLLGACGAILLLVAFYGIYMTIFGN